MSYIVAYEKQPGEASNEREELNRMYGAGYIPIRPGLFLLLSGPHAQQIQSDLSRVLGNLSFLIVARVTDDYALQFHPENSDVQTLLENVLPRRGNIE